MRERFSRLGPSLLLSAAGLLLVLAIATAMLVTGGFREARASATQRSSASLKRQSADALGRLTEREAATTSAELRQIGLAGRQAANFVAAMAGKPGPDPAFSFDRLAQHANSAWYDPNPQRISDIWIAGHTELTARLERDMRAAVALDALFPTLADTYPAIASISYITADGASRSYPVADPETGLAELRPPELDLEQEAFFKRAVPRANPERATVWLAPHASPSGGRLRATATTPVYDGDEFRGTMVVHISLAALVDRLNQLAITPGGYAFLVDQSGRLIAAAPRAREDLAAGLASGTATMPGLDLTRSENQEFVATLSAMRSGEAGVREVRFGQKHVLLAFAPLDGLGWSMGIASPVAEIVSPSVGVSSAIGASADRTLIKLLGLMAALLLLALLGAILLSRRLTHPIAELVAGARALGGGDLSVRVPATSRGELGELAHSFNAMAAELATAQRRLKQQAAELQQSVEQRSNELAQAQQKAEQAQHLSSRFLSNMSHELRTPLNSIINFTEMVSSGMSGPVNDQQLDYLSRAAKGGEHLLGMLNDILDLAKLEASRLELRKERVNIGQLAESVMSTATGLTQGKPIQLRQEIAPQLPMLEADRARVRQVLLNLLSNAARFTRQGSITLRVEQQGQEVVVSVADTGIGIAPEYQEHIFTEFQHAGAEDNSGYHGAGLGLALCRRLVEMLGGRIWLESKPDQGSTFSFSLPALLPRAELESLAPPCAALASDDGRARVLVIDDDLGAVEIISAYLSQDGYSVYGITDSRFAVEEATRIAPAAIVLDVLMPYSDGWQVLSELKAEPQLHGIPIILYTILEEQELGLYLGASAYLTKPINSHELRSTVARLAGENTNVLVIDDDPDTRELIALQLAHGRHYTVSTARDGREGLERIHEDQPDLIILDLMMPDVDGFAVLEQLDQRIETTHIPVIVLTAKDLTDQEREYLAQRAGGLLAKGNNKPEELLDKVAALLATAQ